ncbi:MAG: hypothetical protein A2328_06330 [Bdellovibrionales bacterium RIFOXYB2_FULL_36_6]|nr:MAG: hypothetical protein A2328_06330 [Bdellovibrionales bacterium RIFOXYB2_FULL_36_6]
MTQKITLSIPDLLYEKLEEWRASFNFSKLFQDALAEAIQRKEDFQKRISEDFDMADIIKRLRQEKQNWEKKYYTLGKTYGTQWAKIAHYGDLLYVLKFEDTYKLISDSKMSDYFKKIYETTSLSKNRESSPVEEEQMFMDGWFKGVMEFWNHIKEKL